MRCSFTAEETGVTAIEPLRSLFESIFRFQESHSAADSVGDFAVACGAWGETFGAVINNATLS